MTIADQTLSIWQRGLPPDSVRVEVEDNQDEKSYKLYPSNEAACRAQIRVGKRDEAFDVTLAEHVTFDDVPLSEQGLLNVLDAIRAGKIEMRLLRWRGKVIRAVGTMQVGGEEWLTDWSVMWDSLLTVLPCKTVWERHSFEPF